MFYRRCWFCLWVILLTLVPGIAAAQTGGSANLSPLQIANFPEVSAYLQVFDARGDFIHALRQEDIIVQEDEAYLPLTSWLEIQTGAQFVLAINPGATLAIRDVNGISRFDYLRQAITVQIEAINGPSNDDWSLVTTDGYEQIHLTDPDTWLERLTGYASDVRNATPSMDVLARAIDIVTDPTPRPGMGRAILLITPPPDRAGLAALQSLVARATQEQVRISIWLVAAPEQFSTEASLQLAELALGSQGDFFAFSGTETIPELQTYLEPLRSIYQLGYTSQIQVGGNHNVRVHIEATDLDIESNVQAFEIALAPPNPILVLPPLAIERANRAAIGDALNAEADFSPKTQIIEILVEFPDGRPRDLARTTLYVDGQIAAENTAPPFEQFRWDLSPYTTSGEHIIQVEAEDGLGLSSRSIETRVQITVQQTPQSVVTTLARNGPLTVGLIVALAGSLLLLVLIVGGRLQPRYFGRLRRQAREKRKRAKDPVTQPVNVPAVATRSKGTGWINRLPWPQRTPDQPIPAYLEIMEGKNGDDPGENRIPIQSAELTLGKDPTQASISFNDPSLDDLHTRLRREAGGAYRILDEQSSAGTWVNYTPVPKGGTKLEHGDIIHIGQLALRFILSDTQAISKPIVIPMEPES